MSFKKHAVFRYTGSLILFISCGFSPATLLAHSEHAQSPEDAAEYRQAVMQTMAWNIGMMNSMVKNKQNFEIDDFTRNAENLAFLSKLPLIGFELGKDADDTSAKAKIWENFDDFSKKMREFEKISIELAQATKNSAIKTENLQTLLKRTGETCKNCHKQYKQK
jgi:cytochrome c556